MVILCFLRNYIHSMLGVRCCNDMEVHYVVFFLFFYQPKLKNNSRFRIFSKNKFHTYIGTHCHAAHLVWHRFPEREVGADVLRLSQLSITQYCCVNCDLGDPTEAGEQGCKGSGCNSGEMAGGWDQRSAVQHVRLADQEVLSLASGNTQGVLCFGRTHNLTEIFSQLGDEKASETARGWNFLIWVLRIKQIHDQIFTMNLIWGKLKRVLVLTYSLRLCSPSAGLQSSVVVPSRSSILVIL